MFIIHIPVSSVTVSSTVSVVFSLCFLTKKNIDSKNQTGSAKKSDEIHVENKVRRASKL